MTSLAVAVIPGCDGASVSLTSPDGFFTLAATGAVAKTLDTIQYETGEGPCLAAIDTGAICRLGAEEAEARWREFWARAQAHGFRGALSLPLQVEERVAGSLNLYGWSENAELRADDELTGSLLAEIAAVVLDASAASRRHEDLVEQLNQALASRDIIGQAKGILMAREGCTADEAFDMLRRASQRLNQKLRDVAEQIAQSSRSGPPGPGGPDGRRGG